MAKEISAPDKAQAFYRELSTAATNLNQASDELGKTISALDAALQKLNLGVSAWVEISGNNDPASGNFWSRDLGYARVRGKWGIALRETRGNENWPENEEEETWLFNDAPRFMRIEGVAEIPQLLEKLIKQANDTTNRIIQKTAEAKALTAAISDPAAKGQAIAALESLYGRPAQQK